MYKSRIELKTINGIKHRQCIGVNDNNCQTWHPYKRTGSSRCKPCQAIWKREYDRIRRAGNCLLNESKMNIEPELQGFGKPMSEKVLYQNCTDLQRIALVTGNVELLLRS